MANRSVMKITIPQPFNLSTDRRSLRRPTPPPPPDVDVELVRKFRARPIPVQTFLPLYEQMTKTDNVKRQADRDRLKTQLLAAQKPFSFCDKQNRAWSQSVPEGLNDRTSGKAQRTRQQSLPRRPTSTSDLTAEEAEILREIRIKTRAEFLLRTSALPPGYKQRQEERAQAKLATVKPEPSSETLPVRKRRKPPPLKPTSAPVSRPIIVRSEPQKYRRKSSPKPTENCSTPKMTYASMLRQKLNSERLRKSRQDDTNNQNQFGLERSVRSRVYDGKSRAELNVERLENFRESEKVRLQEYRKEIREMMKRIKSKPLLIDRQSQFNAEQKMEKLFARKLCERGLDPEFVLAESRKGRTPDGSQNSEATEPEEQSSDEEPDEDDDDSNESEEQYQYTSNDDEDDPSRELPERDVP